VVSEGRVKVKVRNGKSPECLMAQDAWVSLALCST
jgi:hypothetical protein